MRLPNPTSLLPTACCSRKPDSFSSANGPALYLHQHKYPLAGVAVKSHLSKDISGKCKPGDEYSCGMGVGRCRAAAVSYNQVPAYHQQHLWEIKQDLSFTLFAHSSSPIFYVSLKQTIVQPFTAVGESQGHPQQHPNLKLWQPTQGIQLMHARESSTVRQEAFPVRNKYIRNCFTYLSLFMTDILSDMSQSPRSASASWNLVMQKVGPGWCVHKLILQGILLKFNFSPGMLSSLGCPCSQCTGTGPFEGHFRAEAQR